MLKKNLRRLLVAACVIGALATTAPAYADDSSAGTPAVITMNAGGGPG